MIGEWILRKMARPLAEAKKDPSDQGGRAPGSLMTLRDSYPGFLEMIDGARVLDYGCGYGDQARAMSWHGAHQVVGFDISEAALTKAREKLELSALKFTNDLSDEGQFDVVVCQNSFEHFLTPDMELCRMLAACKPGGSILITFGPPWHSPWGAHMDAWCRLPWIQNWPFSLLFSESVVMRVRRDFRTDTRGPKFSYWDVGLGQMTVARFERLMSRFALKIPYRRYTCCWGLNFLQHVPIVREWFINHVSVRVKKSW